MILFGLN